MEYIILLSDEFEVWWNTLKEEEPVDVISYVNLLKARGPLLPFPYSSQIKNAKTKHMRELRVKSKGNPIRVLYAFDPNQQALLLIGGNKKGDERWYKKYIPIADKIYEKHIRELYKEKK